MSFSLVAHFALQRTVIWSNNSRRHMPWLHPSQLPVLKHIFGDACERCHFVVLWLFEAIDKNAYIFLVLKSIDGVMHQFVLMEYYAVAQNVKRWKVTLVGKATCEVSYFCVKRTLLALSVFAGFHLENSKSKKPFCISMEQSIMCISRLLMYCYLAEIWLFATSAFVPKAIQKFCFSKFCHIFR